MSLVLTMYFFLHNFRKELSGLILWNFVLPDLDPEPEAQDCQILLKKLPDFVKTIFGFQSQEFVPSSQDTSFIVYSIFCILYLYQIFSVLSNQIEFYSTYLITPYAESSSAMGLVYIPWFDYDLIYTNTTLACGWLDRQLEGLFHEWFIKH